ncbi:hypothetical protein M2J84_09900 [Comamonas aquatica]|jgi:hypothetical protein|uniref:hypothetical protein n=1 Tax=Comamonas aquatica TaxID=225991 RepID=UPI0022DCEE94|nr:hypothetical protein [Comamonas aquatica]WBM40503.1 hypothetical protein M2J84_09900 [Comamonas aquatica]
MRTAQKIVDQSYYNAKDHKDKGLSIKRARTTLAKLNLDELDMSVKEKATITTAIATLDQVAETFMKAHRIKDKKEKLREERRAAAKKLVLASDFAKLSSVKDKVALIAMECFYRNEIYTVKTVFDAKYLLVYTFENTLHAISYSVAQQEGDMSKSLSDAWKKFQEKLPNLYVKHAVVVANIENILATETKKI